MARYALKLQHMIHVMKQILLFLASWLVISCSAKNPSGSGAPVEEIPLDGSFRNADIIRNPVSASEPADTVRVAKMTFENARFHFGEVFEGDVVQHEFPFTNTGTIPLLISDARSTCGCTIPEWPKDPIPPGGKGVLKVRFDTANRAGSQSKPVSITANTYPAVTRVYLEGNVLPRRG